MSPSDIYQKLITAGTEWAEANAAADLFEETKKVVLSKLADETDGSMAAREAHAFRHPDYLKHVKSMVEARKIANIAKVRYASIQTFVDLMRTKEASERAANKHAT